MATCPFAQVMLLPESETQPGITARAVILHSAAGRGSLYRFFRDSSSLESHFWVGEDGRIEQYIDTSRRADANRNANGFAISIETESSTAATERWNPVQAAALARLVAWCCTEHRIPARKITTWDGSGIGYHVQFGSPGPWTPVAKSCPGPARIKQMPEIIAAATPTAPPKEHPLMALTDAEQTELLAKVRATDLRVQELDQQLTDGANAKLGGISRRLLEAVTRIEAVLAKRS